MQYFARSVVLVAVLATTVTAQPSCLSTYAEEAKRCFYDRNLYMARMPANMDVLHPQYEQFETSFTNMDPATHCSDPEAYREAALCTLGVQKACFDPDGSQGMTPVPELVVEGMQVICDRKDEIDFPCYRTFFLTVNDCVELHFRRTPFSPSLKNSICLTSDLAYDCTKALITPLCGNSTADVLLEQLDKYLIPTACFNGTEPSREGRQAVVPLLSPPNQELGQPAAQSGADNLGSASLLSETRGNMLVCLPYSVIAVLAVLVSAFW